MKFYHNLDDLHLEGLPSVVTVGMFDGVHLGHLAVLKKAVQISKENNIPSIVLTFSNPPASYFQPEKLSYQLSTLEEKMALLKKLGIDIVIALSFDSYIASLSAQQFADDILVGKLNAKHIVFGYDNHFGRNREGSKEYMDLHYPLISTYRIEETMVNNEIVSSSLVKNYIQNGKIERVNQLLNYLYYLNGIVIKGDQLGRTIGFPTANIDVELTKIVPQKGVYFTRCYIDDQVYYGMTNIGIRPTVTQSNELRIETHLLNFDKDIYGQQLRVEFVSRMRDETKFDSFPQLVRQLELDKVDALNRLTKIHITS